MFRNMLFLFASIYCSISTDKPLVSKFEPIFAAIQKMLDSPFDSFDFKSAEKFISFSKQLLEATSTTKPKEEELIAIDLQCELMLAKLRNSCAEKDSAVTFMFKKLKLKYKISGITSILKRKNNPIGTHSKSEFLQTLASQTWEDLQDYRKHSRKQVFYKLVFYFRQYRQILIVLPGSSKPISCSNLNQQSLFVNFYSKGYAAPLSMTLLMLWMK
jgi:hypothetical protein